MYEGMTGLHDSITVETSTVICNVSVNSFQFTTPLYPPCYLSSMLFNSSFSFSIFDSGEREREFLSSLSAMEDVFTTDCK